MIPPWSEAAERLIAQLPPAGPSPAAIKQRNDDLAALRACLARAEQADRLEQERDEAREDAADTAVECVEIVRDAEAQIIPVADRERIVRLVVDEGRVAAMEIQHLLKLASPGTRTEEP